MPEPRRVEGRARPEPARPAKGKAPTKAKKVHSEGNMDACLQRRDCSERREKGVDRMTIRPADNTDPQETVKDKVELTDEEWRQRLTPIQFEVTRRAGTEPPFTGEYLHNDKEGTYRCVACGQALFSSETKYDSGSGWPSFTQPIAEGVVQYRRDLSFGMVRTEVLCARCDAHLGHKFPDGPPPTGNRYCINSVALRFEEKA